MTPPGPNGNQTALLQLALAQAGIPKADADEFCAEWPDASPDAFLDGLDIVARILALNEPPDLLAPTEEPWKAIHARMIGAADCNQAFLDALTVYKPNVQIAISDAVQIREGTVKQQAAQNTKGQKRTVKTREYIKALNSLGYSFRLNQCSQRIEVTKGNVTTLISEGLRYQIRCEMRDRGYTQSNIVEEAYTSDAYQHRYHPVCEYLKSLAYDGGQHIDKLSAYVQDKDGVFPKWIRRWLIGAVAKAFTGAQNRVLILEGPQGTGKSTLARWLCSPIPEYFTDAPVTPDVKDCEVLLMSKWIWEVGEFGAATRRADRDILKAFFSRETVTVRVPYDKHPVQNPALASFVGTANNASGLLSDPTGNRRYMSCTVEQINWNYKTDIDVNQIWAEAVMLYLAGEQWQLSSDEAKQAGEINERYEIDDGIEGLLKKFYLINPADDTWWTSSADIVTELEANGLKGTTRGNTMALAETMRRLGIRKAKQQNHRSQLVWGYLGVQHV